MVLGQPLDTGVELLLIALAIPDVTQMSNELQGVQRVLLPSLYHTVMITLLVWLDPKVVQSVGTIL